MRMKIWHRQRRYAIRRHRNLDRLYRFGVGVVGTLMVLAGMVLIPLPIPGPGWATFFLGLGVLSTEFEWAHRVMAFMLRTLRRAGAYSRAVWTRFDAWAHRHVENITGARLVETWLAHRWTFPSPYAFA